MNWTFNGELSESSQLCRRRYDKNNLYYYFSEQMQTIEYDSNFPVTIVQQNNSQIFHPGPTALG